MIKFTEYLTEMASSVEDTALGHLTHVKDIAHEDPQYGQYALQLLQDFHKHRMGKTPKGFGASIKHDGGASVIVKNDANGVAVTDKHRAARGVEARTPADIKKHFGHAPGYAAALNHLLAHGSELVAPGRTIQGDLLYTPKDKTTSFKRGGTVDYTPNRITYRTKTKAPIGLAAHTEYTNGVAHALSPEALNPTPNVFVPEHDYSRPDPATYSKEARKAAEFHMAQASKLLAGHTSEHLTPDHIAQFTIYNNRSARAAAKPTSEGYMQHLALERDKAAKKLKTEKGKNRVRGAWNGMIQQVAANKPSFDRSLAIRHHMEQATEHMLSGISHPDLETRIDGKRSPGEGVVLQKQDTEGRMRPVGKLVPMSVQYALGNNPRFSRQQPLKESIIWLVKEVKAKQL
jgi:hypothetical protein